MTRKMTITLEESILSELDTVAENQGKKKSQIIREALTSYLNIASKDEKAEQWYKENKEAIDAYNKEVEEEGLILKDSRMF
ncbi:type II toxin-antitoxin system CcdA family antitoxin [Poseidonibacter lekithochrous]|uniref:type II toxin-antitoxin system CcdA family antitoxin n=1 Tax=Poseidonibacter lekithochrous TaxID=1904463 RepID=UPI0008FC65FC|nr:type II toxin-antitoxin system CcdA family antitoxin [Poseidonibacter lekithochrous]QKJ23233.1 post-segregation antitoxin CcdA [Poseidonibacter lekithochrous]